MNADASPPAAPVPAKEGASKGCRVIFLTGLVLVIAGIIVAIVTWLFAAVGGKTVAESHESQAKKTMKALATAIQGYREEYGHAPLAPDPPPEQDRETHETSEASGRVLLDALLGVDKAQNPRGIRFWQADVSKTGYSSEAGLIDPWGRNGYRLLLDDNSDGHVPDPQNDLGDISGSAVIYSAGPDGDFKTWKDNVCSWK